MKRLHNYVYFLTHLIAFLTFLRNYFPSHSPDIDECSMANDCDMENGICTNTNGSYKCSCVSGYSGDGFNCTGKITLSDGAIF